MKELKSTRMSKNLTGERLLFAAKLTFGTVAATIAAEQFGIDFAPSTGIITLLTINTSQAATFRRSVLRVISFMYTFLFALFVHDGLNLTGIVGFALAAALVIFVSILLGWDVTLSVNGVILIQLFLDKMDFGWPLFYNEALRLFIGLSVSWISVFVFKTRRFPNPDEDPF